MNKFRLFLASIALTAFSLFPAIAAADIDELDVTMEVLDGVGDLDGEIIEMPGPGGDSEDSFGDSVSDIDEDGRDEDDSVDDLREEEDFRDEDDDDFEHDEEFESEDDEAHSEDESDFDEGDEIDNDEFDIIDEMEDEMDDDVADNLDDDMLENEESEFQGEDVA